jgi:hypothetical protein
MKKKSFLILIAASCKPTKDTIVSDEKKINMLLDSWHKAAADAKYDSYFEKMTDDAILSVLMRLVEKPAFQLLPNLILIKESLEFTALERHIYFDKRKKWLGLTIVKYTNENMQRFRSTGENRR